MHTIFLSGLEEGKKTKRDSSVICTLVNNNKQYW
jgi:hypothetical protein